MDFNIEFIVSLLAALYASYLVSTGSPNVSPFITFLLLPLIIAFIVVAIINNVVPGINKTGRSMYNYGENIALGGINETGYIQMFPPILIVLIIFSILLYSRMLG